MELKDTFFQISNRFIPRVILQKLRTIFIWAMNQFKRLKVTFGVKEDGPEQIRNSLPNIKPLTFVLSDLNYFYQSFVNIYYASETYRN